MKKSTKDSGSGTSADQRHEIRIGGRPVAIAVRRSRRARRMALKLDRRRAGIELVLPWRTALGQGLRFAVEQADWIAARLADLPAPVDLVDGAVVPFRGIDHRLRHLPGAAAGVRREAGEILASGAAEAMPRRLTLWLKAAARDALVDRALEYAGRLEAEFHGLTVRDARTRWAVARLPGGSRFPGG